jgi:hypothetical protein
LKVQASGCQQPYQGTGFISRLRFCSWFFVVNTL